MSLNFAVNGEKINRIDSIGIIPTPNRDLGASTEQWKDLYLSSNYITLDNKVLTLSTSSTLNFNNNTVTANTDSGLDFNSKTLTIDSNNNLLVDGVEVPYIKELVEDTSPQLGGILDLNGFNIHQPNTITGFTTRLDFLPPTVDRTLSFPDAGGVLATFTDIPTTITQLGITDGNAGQVLSTDGNGTFTFTDVYTLPILTSAPASPVNGMIAVSDGSGWDPHTTGQQEISAYLNNAWVKLS